MSGPAGKGSGKVGPPLGTQLHSKEKRDLARITAIEYDESQFQEKEVLAVEDCLPIKDAPTVTWINIDHIGQMSMIEKIGHSFNIHPLVLEDIVNTEHRPKMKDFADYIFVVLKMLTYDEKKREIDSRQVSLILRSGFVISFQETREDILDPIRERIRSDRGRIRKMGADYLAYAIIDAIVDNYFNILEKLGEVIEELEDELIINPTPETLQAIYSMKKEMVLVRKSVWPLREVISRLERWDSALIDKALSIYLRDVYDHTIQVIDSIETYRDMLSGLLDIYLSSVSNRMNEVMKVLTIMATIFIPLTLIAGIYGMNFKYMPELEQPWAYPMVYVAMLATSVVMLIYFRRKRWL